MGISPTGKTVNIYISGTAALALLAMGLAACGKSPPGNASPTASHSRHSSTPLLTKEEVGAVLGQPVTSMEGAATDMAYKTAVVGLEVSIGVEEERDAEGAMTGARKATGMLGGAAEEMPHLGDEAFFGAMAVLYVRRGDTVITITPPNLQLVASVAAYNKVADAKLGSDEQAKALQEFQQVEKTDPTMAGLKKGDDVQGALAVVTTSSKQQGASYEVQARAIVVALATKVLSKP